jgi:hypothetical protein
MNELANRKICRNCKAPLHGDYCSVCGQQENRPDIHFSEILGDTIGNLFVWDSRFYRTLIPLLVRPGFLTLEFIEGRKAGYVPPIRLYLFISFFLFLLLSLVPTEGLVKLDSDGYGNIVIGSKSVEPDIPGQDIPQKPGSEARGIAFEFDGWDDANKPAWIIDLEGRANENIDSIGNDPGAFLSLLIQRLPQMMFLLLPVFAALVQLSYLFSPFHYLQHLVFSLHYHTFIYLLYLVGWLTHRVGSSAADAFFFLALLVYLPLALKKVYRSHLAVAIGKSLVIYLSYAFVLSFFVTLFVIINLISL